MYAKASDIKSSERVKMNLFTAINNALDIELAKNKKYPSNYILDHSSLGRMLSLVECSDVLRISMRNMAQIECSIHHSANRYQHM